MQCDSSECVYMEEVGCACVCICAFVCKYLDEVECIWMSQGVGGRVSVTDSGLLKSAIV